MNKQNKKIAQQKRAEERKKAEKRAAVIKKLKFWVPVIAVVIVVVVLVWAVATSGNALLHQIHSQEQKVQAQVLQHRIRRAHLRVKKHLIRQKVWLHRMVIR